MMVAAVLPSFETFLIVVGALILLAAFAPKTITAVLLGATLLWAYLVVVPAYVAGVVSWQPTETITTYLLVPSLFFIIRSYVERNGRPHWLKQIVVALIPGASSTAPAPQTGNSGNWIRDFISPISGIDDDPGAPPEQEQPQQPPQDTDYNLFPDDDDFTHDEEDLPGLDDDVDAIDDFRR